MKKIFYFLAVSALLVSSCSKEILKSDVEAGFAEAQPLPTVTIESLGDYDPLTESLAVTAKFTGVTGLDRLSMGILVSTDPTFTESEFVPAEQDSDGTYTIAVPGAELETNYIMAVAACGSGTSYSDVKSFDYPKGLPWYSKVPGTYTADGIESYFGDEYTFAVTILPDEEDPENKVIVANLEPYFASAGLDYENGFQAYEGILDEENHLVIVPAYQFLGYKETVLVGFNDADPDEADGYDDIYLYIDKAAKTMTILNAFGPTDEEGFWELYYGNISLKRAK